MEQKMHKPNPWKEFVMENRDIFIKIAKRLERVKA